MKPLFTTLAITSVLLTESPIHANIATKGDFDGDGRQDTVLFHRESGNLLVGFGSSAGDANHDKWIDILAIDWGAHKPASQPDVADFDGNGFADIVLADHDGNRVHLVQGQRNGGFRRTEFPVAGPIGAGFADVVRGGSEEMVVLANGGPNGPELFSVDSNGERNRLGGVELKKGIYSGFRVIKEGTRTFVVSTSNHSADVVPVDQISFNFTEIKFDPQSSMESVPMDHFYTRTTEVAMFDGQAHTILWDPGHDGVAVFALLLPAVNQVREAPRSNSAPVGGVVVVPKQGGDNVLVTNEDGARATLYVYLEGELQVLQHFSPPNGQQFAAAQVLNEAGDLQFTLKQPNGDLDSIVKYRNAGGRYVLENGSSKLEAFLSKKPKTTVVAYTKHPLLNRDAYELERFAQGHWASSAQLQGGGIQANVQTFGGVSAGLGTTQSVNLNPAVAVDGVLGNQFEADSSICFQGPAGFSGIAAVSVDPPAGDYGVSVGMRFQKHEETKVIYRINGGNWTTWNDHVVFLTKTSSVEYYGQHDSGLLSQIDTAEYVINQSLSFADANKDGLPDVVATSYGLSPFGNGNADGDAFSDLDEILAGTDPNNAKSTPEKSTLVSQRSFQVALKDVEGGIVKLVRLDGSVVARGTVSRAGTATLNVPYDALQGVGLAVFSKGEVEMAAGVSGFPSFPEISFVSVSDWLEKARAAVSPDRRAESVVEISPESTLEVLAFESWLGESLVASGRIASLAEAPSIFPSTHGLSKLLPRLGNEILASATAAYDLEEAMTKVSEGVRNTAKPQWDAALTGVYDSGLADPVDALRQLFFENKAPAGYANLKVVLPVLAQETAKIKEVKSDSETVSVSGSLAVADANCLVLTAPNGTTYALTETDGTPFWPESPVLNGSSASVRGVLGENQRDCADHALIALSVTIIAPSTIDPSIVDTDGDSVDDTYEEAFYGTLDYGPNDDPDGNGVTLGQAYHQGLPPKGDPTIQEPTTPRPIKVVIRPGALPGDLILTWTAEPGRSFDVSTSDSLTNWRSAGGNVTESEPGVYSWKTVTIPEFERVRFYRVMEE